MCIPNARQRGEFLGHTDQRGNLLCLKNSQTRRGGCYGENTEDGQGQSGKDHRVHTWMGFCRMNRSSLGGQRRRSNSRGDCRCESALWIINYDCVCPDIWPIPCHEEVTLVHASRLRNPQLSCKCDSQPHCEMHFHRPTTRVMGLLIHSICATREAGYAGWLSKRQSPSFSDKISPTGQLSFW